MKLLTVDKLTKTFGGFRAVDDVSFSVTEGAIHAVIGPNGAGKSTMFNLITGQLRPTSGGVKLDGTDVTGRSPDLMARSGLTRAFQVTNIFPRLSVLDSVECAVNARLRHSASPFLWRRRSARNSALKLIDTVGLDKVRDSIAATLSHGDQRTLEVTLALAAEPRLLLLDEPTAGMSPWETERMVKLVQTLAQTHGVTVLFCEHDMDTVFSISDQVTVLHRGQIIADGDPQTVHNDEQVASVYLGTPAPEPET